MENPTNVIVNKPNIVLITVDQLRFPMHFLKLKDKAGNFITTANKFVEEFMPHLWEHLWNPGAKFSNYYTAASDCTAARATIHTGLYAYQTYSMLTLITYPPKKPPQPVLNTAFPTIGKLMGAAGYQTPYFGKWHLSYDAADLTDYGYESFTPNNDYVGYSGEGQATDDSPAYEAAHWINEYVRNVKSKTASNPNYVPDPFFLTLNFVNPHDKQWFWGAMEADKFYGVYNSVKQAFPNEMPPGPYVNIVPQNEPTQIYPVDIEEAIPNFQRQTELDVKPKAQSVVKEVFQYQMGGIYEVDEKSKYTFVTQPAGFAYADAPAHPPDHKAIAPQSYWSRALDSYVQLMTMVDRSLGNFMKSLSEETRNNTIFIFTSDHGEYGSSHGLQGKGGTVYDEGIRVPLIVRDSRPNSFVVSPGTERNQLTSSVDLLPMIVTMGNGSDAWMTGAENPYRELYENRCKLLNILGNTSALGRPYALHTTDEFVPNSANFNSAPLHVIGLIQLVNASNPSAGKTKLGVYTDWQKFEDSPLKATVINPLSLNPVPPRTIEFYKADEYVSATQEPLERISTPDAGASADAFLFNTLFATELQKPLPLAYQEAQTAAYIELVEYMAEVNAIPTPSTQTSTMPEEIEVLLARAWAL
jgi:arylsulfatase A-like enzyme